MTVGPDAGMLPPRARSPVTRNLRRILQVALARLCGSRVLSPGAWDRNRRACRHNTSDLSGSGDLVSVIDSSGDISAPALLVPAGYVSGHALSDTSTYNTATFASLGVTPGTYEWTWGRGVHADSFTLQIGPVAAVPEPASLPLLVMGLAGLGMVVRRRRA